jgi:hypothetical protein
MSFDALLLKSCSIEQNTPTQDDAGQMIEGWSAVVSGLPCRLDPTEGGVTDTPQSIYELATHIMFMREPATPADFNTKDHRIDVDGDKFVIILISKVYGYSALDHLELYLEKVE